MHTQHVFLVLGFSLPLSLSRAWFWSPSLSLTLSLSLSLSLSHSLSLSLTLSLSLSGLLFSLHPSWNLFPLLCLFKFLKTHRCLSSSLFHSVVFSWLAIFAMMVFLFIVLVVILNILIAQLSDTYADVKSDAERTLERNWAQALKDIEQSNSFSVSWKYNKLYIDNHPNFWTLQFVHEIQRTVFVFAWRSASAVKLLIAKTTEVSVCSWLRGFKNFMGISTKCACLYAACSMLLIRVQHSSSKRLNEDFYRRLKPKQNIQSDCDQRTTYHPKHTAAGSWIFLLVENYARQKLIRTHSVLLSDFAIVIIPSVWASGSSRRLVEKVPLLWLFFYSRPRLLSRTHFEQPNKSLTKNQECTKLPPTTSDRQSV